MLECGVIEPSTSEWSVPIVYDWWCTTICVDAKQCIDNRSGTQAV